MNRSSVSVVIPTWKRVDQLKVTVKRLLDCDPLPGEILIQVDSEDDETLPAITSEFRDVVSIQTNQTRMGPGGSRNILIGLAKHPVVVTFDDDSYPIENDFFAWTEETFSCKPTLGAIGFRVFLKNEQITPSKDICQRSRSFENAAAAFRRSAFLETRGFLPLRFAYGMEESDVAMQLMDRDWDVLFTDLRRAYHDTLLSHHNTMEVTAAHISNTALLGFLRFPAIFLPLAAIQTLNRVLYSCRVGRWKGIGKGIIDIPKKCVQFRNERQPVKAATIRRMRSIL